MGFNSGFKGLISSALYYCILHELPLAIEICRVRHNHRTIQ